jgi:hypothetical protein
VIKYYNETYSHLVLPAMLAVHRLAMCPVAPHLKHTFVGQSDKKWPAVGDKKQDKTKDN